jgi:hypothetical protein
MALSSKVSTNGSEQGVWRFGDYINHCDKCGRPISTGESFLYFQPHNKMACEDCVDAANEAARIVEAPHDE